MFSAQTGDTDLQQKDCNGLGEYLINSGLDNCGIKGRTDRQAKVFPANTITIDFWGNAFYRDFEYKMATHNHVFSLSGDIIKNRRVGIFLANQFSYMRKVFSYNYMGTWNKMKEMYIFLPTKNKEIDFSFMENFIAELEAERVAELEAYLEATGLKDCQLTKDEKQVIRGGGHYKLFLLSDIFLMKNTKSIMQNQITPNSGQIPYVTASANDNGIMTYIKCPDEWLEDGNCIMIGGKTLTFTYQENKFCSNDSHNISLYNKEEDKRNKLIYLFMMATLNKYLSPKYSWGNSISMKKIKNDYFSLPVNSNGDVDYNYMEKYISAVQKIIIADVVQYAENKLLATKR